MYAGTDTVAHIVTALASPFAMLPLARPCPQFHREEGTVDDFAPVDEVDAGERHDAVAVERDGAGQATVFGKGAKTRVILLPPSTWQAAGQLRGDASPDDPMFRYGRVSNGGLVFSKSGK